VTRIECVGSPETAEWLRDAPGAVAITTYQAGKVVVLGWSGGISMLPVDFDKPLGLARDGDRLALATRHAVVLLANAPALARDFDESRRGRYDALYLPRALYHTGDVNAHDLAYTSEGLVLCNTRFSCLARLSDRHNFEVVWKPPFISRIAPEDRCHLNGAAVVDGRAKYVTALGESDVVGGWREGKASGGVVIDVESGEIAARGLSMPHSPRWREGALWLLNSGEGRLVRMDPKDGRTTDVCELPGYLRGLSFAGPYALVGLSRIRERHIFGGLPIQQRGVPLKCGAAIVDLRTGRPAGLFEFTAGVEEIFEVLFLPGAKQPMLTNATVPATRDAFTSPECAYWLRPSTLIRE
jgi:uncharacterized protein (TIGR03032 family)